MSPVGTSFGQPGASASGYWLRQRKNINGRAIGVFALIALILLIAYWPTILRQPAGSDDPLLEDSGEYQVALNIWGTVHGTGYPLYTIAGNLFVHTARLIGVDPALAPSLFSLACGLIALAIGYTLILKLTGQIPIAAVAILLFGLSRATWAYDVFPKTYSLSLIFYFGLFAIAVWPPRNGIAIDARRRLWWLALIGGFAVAHHRLLAFVIPGVIIAIMVEVRRVPGAEPHPPAPSPFTERGSQRARFWKSRKVVWKSLSVNGEGFRVRFRDRFRVRCWTLALCLPLAAIGFLPYLYLPARALAHANWVYGDPGTPIGFWHEFTATEANYLFTPAPNFSAFLDSAKSTLALFPIQWTPIGALILLLLALIGARRRYEARIAFLCAIPLLIFVLIWPRAVVAQAVVQPIGAFLLIAAALGIAEIIKALADRRKIIAQRAIPIIGAIGAAALIAWNFADLSAISNAPLGVQEIFLANSIPGYFLRDTEFGGNPMFILPWGTRYSAVAFAYYVTGKTLAAAIGDHKTDLEVWNNKGYSFFTDKDELYTLPPEWWRAQLGAVLIDSPNNDLIEIQPLPTLGGHVTYPFSKPLPNYTDGISWVNASLTCAPPTWGNNITLHVQYVADHTPSRNYSVFVHLIGSDPANVLTTADESAPVYGWAPTSTWPPNEFLYDTYPIEWKPGAQAVQFGFYEQPQPGKFINYGTTTLYLKDFSGCTR